MKKTLGVICIIPFLVWAGIRIWQDQYTFRTEVGGYMQNAANANTVDLATKEMERVVKYIENRYAQPGFTSVVYNTPEEDVGFWVSNMRASLDELKQVKPETTSLEKSNILIKLRETLTHRTKDSTEISVPTGISVYPHNFGFMIWGVLSSLLAIVGVVLFLIGWDEY